MPPLRGLSWLILGSEGLWADGLPWLAQRVLGTEGQRVSQTVRHTPMDAPESDPPWGKNVFHPYESTHMLSINTSYATELTGTFDRHRRTLKNLAAHGSWS